MMIFDFLKKLLGWADEGSRQKRRANSFGNEKEFVTVKKHKCNPKACSKEEVIEIDNDSDNEDVKIIAVHKNAPLNSCARLNGSHSYRNKSYCCRAQSYSSTPKPSSQRVNHTTGAEMGYFADKSSQQKALNRVPNHRCPTLTKAQQLRDKDQYEELLQTLRSHNLDKHVPIKRVEPRKPPTIPVIELDKTEPSTSRSNESFKTPLTEMRWSSRSKKENRVSPEPAKKNESSYTLPKKPEVRRSTSTSEKSVLNVPIECITTNSLRDTLSAKAVVRGDFIPQVAKRYNERIEQQHKEAEELKKMTCVLSKHNRLAREAALEEQLARSMRLCEAVLDEREEPEEPPLPTLTDEMLQEIKSALIPRPPDEVLVEGFGLRITRKDLHTLSDLNWLNDEVINFYMNLLIARGTGEKYPRVHAMNTFFYPKLLSGGHASLKRWTRKIDVFAQDLIVVPVHLDIHWCMAIIDFRDKSIRYYDSMGGSNARCLSALRQYLEDESMDKKKKPYDTSDWKLESMKDIPQQMNGSDCGVFSCMFAEYICANRKITFTQQDMPYFRNKMVYEILKSKLL